MPRSERAGLHGLRVEGHNSTKNGLGADIAQAHGLWKSNAVRRYDRFAMDQVVRIPSVIMGADDGDNLAPTNEARSRGPSNRRMRRSDVQPARASEGGTPAMDGAAGEEDDVNSDRGASDENEEVTSQSYQSDRSGEGTGQWSDPDEARRFLAANNLMHLTPSGHSAVRPEGYWGMPSARRGPVPRAQSPPSRRRSPSGSLHADA